MSANSRRELSELLSQAEWQATQLRPGSQRRIEIFKITKEARSMARRGRMIDAIALARKANSA